MATNKQITEELISKLSHKDQVRFALFCANQTREFWYGSNVYETTCKLVELWLEGKATIKECINASNACYGECNSYSNGNKTLTNDFVYAGRAILYAAQSVNETHYTNTHVELVSTNTIMAFSFGFKHTADTYKAEQDQLNYYNELRYIDENFEKIVLKGNA
jgi:hypothetical protein